MTLGHRSEQAIMVRCLGADDHGLTIARTVSSKKLSSKGLSRNSIAPPFNARARISASPYAVMKIIGMRRSSRANLAWSSSPLIPGISRSEIKHAVWAERPESKNSSAEPNVRTVKPIDDNAPWSALRTDSSSSTTATKRDFADTGLTHPTLPSDRNSRNCTKGCDAYTRVYAALCVRSATREQEDRVSPPFVLSRLPKPPASCA